MRCPNMPSRGREMELLPARRRAADTASVDTPRNAPSVEVENATTTRLLSTATELQCSKDG
jgi:hypothetical protein